jgi:hypothetical protein
VSLPTIANHGHCNVPTKYTSTKPVFGSLKGTLTGYTWKERDRNDSCIQSLVGLGFEWDGVTWEERLSDLSTTAKSKTLQCSYSYKETQSLLFGSEPQGAIQVVPEGEIISLLPVSRHWKAWVFQMGLGHAGAVWRPFERSLPTFKSLQTLQHS